MIHIPIKFHEDLYNGYWVMVRISFFLQYWKGHNPETKKSGDNHFCVEHIVFN